MTPVNPIRPRDIAWSVLAAAHAGCRRGGRARDPGGGRRGLRVHHRRAGPRCSQLPRPCHQGVERSNRRAHGEWPGTTRSAPHRGVVLAHQVEVPQPAFTTDSTWTGTVDLAAQPVAVQGLYQIEISKDPADCPPSTGWLQISGGNPFLTVPGAIGTGMAVVGSIAIVVALRGALAGRGGTDPRCDRRRPYRARSAHRGPAGRSGAGRRPVRRGLDGATGCRRGDGDAGGREGLWAGRAECGAAQLRIATADVCRRATAARAAVARGTTDERRRRASAAPRPSHPPTPPPSHRLPGRRRATGGHGADPPRVSYAHLDAPDAVVALTPFDLDVGLAAEPDADVDAAPIVRPAWSHGAYTLTIQLLADGFERSRSRSGSVADRPGRHRPEAISDGGRAAPRYGN